MRRASTVISVACHSGLVICALSFGLSGGGETAAPTFRIQIEEPLDVAEDAPVVEALFDEPPIEDVSFVERVVEFVHRQRPVPEELLRVDPKPARKVADWRQLGSDLLLPTRKPAVEESPPPVVVAEASSRVVEAVAGQNPPPTYPRRARRRGWEGLVVLVVSVNARGEVVACKVARSSGRDILDSAAMTAVRGWRFQNGPGQARVPIEFLLRR